MRTSTDFGARPTKPCDHLGLTQEQFARPLGVSLGTVNVRKNGKREPLAAADALQRGDRR
jgi:transcriptional regulator with XRE-family HTH domain